MRTEEQIAAIRCNADRCNVGRCHMVYDLLSDRAELVREVERLRGQQRLTEIDYENELAENERLREAARDVLGLKP